jgi:hypothetical protein
MIWTSTPRAPLSGSSIPSATRCTNEKRCFGPTTSIVRCVMLTSSSAAGCVALPTQTQMLTFFQSWTRYAPG